MIPLQVFRDRPAFPMHLSLPRNQQSRQYFEERRLPLPIFSRNHRYRSWQEGSVRFVQNSGVIKVMSEMNSPNHFRLRAPKVYERAPVKMTDNASTSGHLKRSIGAGTSMT